MSEARSVLLSAQAQDFLGQLVGHTGPVTEVAFSPDGQTLASSGFDDTIRLWSVASHALIATLIGHTGPVIGVAFSPDGHMLATSSSDDTVRLWDPDTDRVTVRLCHIIGIPSQEEWERLIPDVPYQPTCP